MSIYNDASLIYYPSGYKAGTAYSLKPTDGSGDLTFTRASSATRVNAEGLIETASVISPTELVVNGDFATDTGWTKGTGVTISGGSLNFSGVLSSVNTYQSSSIEIGKRYLVTFTISNYTSGGIRAIIGSSGFTDIRTSNGTFTTDVVASGNTTIYLQSQSGTSTYSIDNVSVKEVIENNVPRIDYTGGGCGKLLLEPQRANLVLRSEEFDNAAWAKLNATISANAATSPDGYTNADKLIPSNGALLSSISNYALQTITKAASAIQYTYSVFAKQSGLNRITVFVQGTSAANQANFTVSLVNGTISTAAATAGSFTGATASVSDYGNGWYRCALVFTTNTDTVVTLRNIPTDSTLTTGDGTSGILIYGSQLEAGSYATSYIPTTTTAVTRLADAAFKTGISSLIGQTEGTLFAEFKYDGVANSGVSERILAVSDGTADNTIVLLKNTTLGTIYFYVGSGGSIIVNAAVIAGTSIVGGTHKVAAAYKSGQYAVFFNGVLVFTSTAAVVPPTTSFFVGTDQTGLVRPLGGTIAQAILFKTALSDDDLTLLTGTLGETYFESYALMANYLNYTIQ